MRQKNAVALYEAVKSYDGRERDTVLRSEGIMNELADDYVANASKYDRYEVGLLYRHMLWHIDIIQAYAGTDLVREHVMYEVLNMRGMIRRRDTTRQPRITVEII